MHLTHKCHVAPTTAAKHHACKVIPTLCPHLLWTSHCIIAFFLVPVSFFLHDFKIGLQDNCLMSIFHNMPFSLIYRVQPNSFIRGSPGFSRYQISDIYLTIQNTENRTGMPFIKSRIMSLVQSTIQMFIRTRHFQKFQPPSNLIRTQTHEIPLINQLHILCFICHFILTFLFIHAIAIRHTPWSRDSFFPTHLIA